MIFFNKIYTSPIKNMKNRIFDFFLQILTDKNLFYGIYLLSNFLPVLNLL